MTFDQLSNDVSALAEGWRDYRQDDRSWIDHPALIRQLYDEMHSAGSKSSGGGVKMRPVYGSRPPLAEEPWEVLADIETEARAMLADLGAACRADLCQGLKLILSLAGSSDVTAIARTVRNWRRRAEVALSYRQPSRRLAAPCPACSRRHSLLVVVDDWGPESARCSECEAEWDYDKLGLLAELLAGATNGDGVGQATERIWVTRG